jgi:hypothetical protein
MLPSSFLYTAWRAFRDREHSIQNLYQNYNLLGSLPETSASYVSLLISLAQILL